MFNPSHTIWNEKYRPETLETYVGNPTVKETFQQYIKTNDVPHLLLHGDAGSGKTTLAKIVANTIAKDNYIYINASDENSVDTVRDKIKQFASSIGFGGLKLIILDECDYMTPNAQAALRNVIETFSKTTRFILTCNYVEKIIDPIQSRCQIFNIVPPSKKEVAQHLVNILESEKVTYNKEHLVSIINSNYPDIRRVINTTQRCVIDGKLKLDESTLVETNYFSTIVDLLKSDKNKREKFEGIRQILADNHARDFNQLFRYLYDNVDSYASGFVSTIILIIAETQYKDSFVVDHEINAMSMFIQIIMEIEQRRKG
jgi:DNA polymerase III delta prime subunit